MSPLALYFGIPATLSDIGELKYSGVVAQEDTLSDLKVFGKVGGRYSNSQTSQRYSDSQTKEIKLIDDTIFAQPNQVYQIRFPDNDIKVRAKSLKNVDFS